MGHCRESLQRRKFSISIALKRVFILGRFNEADFAQNVDFVGAITGSWKGFARGGKVCGEESIDSQFPHVKSVRKKEGKLWGKLFFVESGETRERREEISERKAQSVNWNCKINVQRYSVYNGSSRADGVISSSLVRIFLRFENIWLEERSNVREKWFRCFPLQEFPRARPLRTQPA